MLRKWKKAFIVKNKKYDYAETTRTVLSLLQNDRPCSTVQYVDQTTFK